jgi:hypothetical protein
VIYCTFPNDCSSRVTPTRPSRANSSGCHTPEQLQQQNRAFQRDWWPIYEHHKVADSTVYGKFELFVTRFCVKTQHRAMSQSSLWVTLRNGRAIDRKSTVYNRHLLCLVYHLAYILLTFAYIRPRRAPPPRRQACVNSRVREIQNA